MSASIWGVYLAQGVPAVPETATKPSPFEAWGQYLTKGTGSPNSIPTAPPRTPAKGLDGWGTYLARGPTDPNVYLLFGKTGWIGGKLIELLRAKGKTVYLAESRTYDREAVLREIDMYKPTHILNAAGVTGKINNLPVIYEALISLFRSPECRLV